MRRLPRLFAFGLAAIALSACATGPAPRPLVASVTGAEGAFQGAPHSDWPTSAWWETFGDPQLDALIDEGLKGSPTLAQAAARVRTAQALTAQTASQSLPKLSGSASYTEVKADFPPILTGYHDTGLLLLNFGWDLDFFGSNRAAVAAAVSDARAAQAEAAEARLGLTTAIAATYADLARLYAERDVAERALAVRQETEGLVVKRGAGWTARGARRPGGARRRDRHDTQRTGGPGRSRTRSRSGHPAATGSHPQALRPA
jgi:outer membrane protein TolC